MRKPTFQGDSGVLACKPRFCGELRRLVEGCITRHVDRDALRRTEEIEGAERATMRKIGRRERH